MYGKKLKELRRIEGWTQEEVAKKLGVSKQTYSHYENENRRPSLDTIRQLATVYQVNIDDIFSDEKISDIKLLPVVGHISYDNGIVKFENIESYEPTPKKWIEKGEYFYWQAKEDSMIGARIYQDDLLLIRRQNEVKNGDLAIVRISNESLLKRIYIYGELLVLQSESPKSAPIIIPADEVVVIGKLVMNLIKF